MKRTYSAPSSTIIAMKVETFLCMSYGGDGAGRPAESIDKDFEADEESWDDCQDF